MKSVVITGASTGIGWATAKLLLDRGFRVFGSVRKPADADRLRSEFGANFTPLLFDVTDEAAALAAAREVRNALNGETLAVVSLERSQVRPIAAGEIAHARHVAA